jgi:phosphocarrier protein HPr
MRDYILARQQQLLKIAAKYKSDFFIHNNGMNINGKSIIGVMTLAAAKGSTLSLSFDGEDEEKLAHEIIEYFNRGFDEM